MQIGQNHTDRDAPQRISPQDRARLCRTIHRCLEIEAAQAAAAKRNARLRMAIGLPPFPSRMLDWKRCQ
jgi:hypothetical protein